MITMVLNQLVGLYYKLGSFLPKTTLELLQKKLKLAGIKEDAKLYAGKIIFLSLIFLLLPHLINFIYSFFYSDKIFSETILIYLNVATTFFIFLLSYVNLSILISSRAERAEEVFPDFLYDIGLNLNSGMSAFHAFLTSASKKEFGILSEEAKSAYQKYQSESLSLVFKELGESFDSLHIKNFATFFERSIVLGGRLGDLLQSYAEEMKTVLNMRKSLKEKTFSQTIFISIITTVIFPFLLSLAYLYILMLTSLSPTLKTFTTENFPAYLSLKINLNKNEIFNVFILFIILSSLTTSFLLATIRKGKLSFFLKYFIPVILTSLFIFFISIEGLKRIFVIKI